MTHQFAKIVKRIQVRAVTSGAATWLPVGSEIKNVRLEDHGRYEFESRIDKTWVELWTEDDLPTYTDKGRAHDQLNRGHPAMFAEPADSVIGLRVTRRQLNAIRRKADDLPVSEYLRKLLRENGVRI